MSTPASYLGVSPKPGTPKPAAGPGRQTGGHWVTVQAWSANMHVVGLLGPEGARPRDVQADWNIISRPGHVGITEFAGRANRGQDLNLILGGVDRVLGRKPYVDTPIATLEVMLGPPAHTVRVIGPVAHTGRQWVLEGIDYRDELRDQATGARTRADLMLHLLEYAQIDDFARLPRATAPAVPTRNYTLRQGDNLSTIAQRMLGKASRWPEIEQLNAGMRGSKLDQRLYRPGQIIRIPAR